MTNHQLIEKLYTSFQKGDWAAMQECYHNDIQFYDPVFQNLKGKTAKAMWHMLLSNAQDLKINFSEVHAADNKGRCHWEASYKFSKTGRNVLNKIDAAFEFKDGLIISHHDHFNLWRWSGMALGLTGKLLGWTNYLKGKIRSNARKGLDGFIQRNITYQ